MMLNEWLEIVANLITQSTWLAPALALLAGVLTSFSPCALVSVPLVIAYVGGSGRDNPRTAFKLSLLFALGMALTFTLMGALAAVFGHDWQVVVSCSWHVDGADGFTSL